MKDENKEIGKAGAMTAAGAGAGALIGGIPGLIVGAVIGLGSSIVSLMKDK